MYPHLNVSDVVGAVHLPLDGQCDPANIAMALAKGAACAGRRYSNNESHCRSQGQWPRDRCLVERPIRTRAVIDADIVVNCAGMWARDLGAMSASALPLHACEHFYLVTEPVEGLTRLPLLRVPDECAYYKEDAAR